MRETENMTPTFFHEYFDSLLPRTGGICCGNGANLSGTGAGDDALVGGLGVGEGGADSSGPQTTSCATNWAALRFKTNHVKL